MVIAWNLQIVQFYSKFDTENNLNKKISMVELSLDVFRDDFSRMTENDTYTFIFFSLLSKSNFSIHKM